MYFTLDSFFFSAQQDLVECLMSWNRHCPALHPHPVPFLCKLSCARGNYSLEVFILWLTTCSHWHWRETNITSECKWQTLTTGNVNCRALGPHCCDAEASIELSTHKHGTLLTAPLTCSVSYPCFPPTPLYFQCSNSQVKAVGQVKKKKKKRPQNPREELVRLPLANCRCFAFGASATVALHLSVGKCCFCTPVDGIRKCWQEAPCICACMHFCLKAEGKWFTPPSCFKRITIPVFSLSEYSCQRRASPVLQ